MRRRRQRGRAEPVTRLHNGGHRATQTPKRRYSAVNAQQSRRQRCNGQEKSQCTRSRRVAQGARHNGSRFQSVVDAERPGDVSRSRQTAPVETDTGMKLVRLARERRPTVRERAQTGERSQASPASSREWRRSRWTCAVDDRMLTEGTIPTPSTLAPTVKAEPRRANCKESGRPPRTKAPPAAGDERLRILGRAEDRTIDRHIGLADADSHKRVKARAVVPVPEIGIEERDDSDPAEAAPEGGGLDRPGSEADTDAGKPCP